MSDPFEHTLTPEPDRLAISVILPVRNGGSDFVEQLHALLQQDLAEPWELIIVDNGSTDGSAGNARDALGRGLPTCLVHTEITRYDAAHGHASPRNHGASLAQADWLAFCDADDVVSPEWLRKLLAASSTGDLVASDFVRLDGAGEAEGPPRDRRSPALPVKYGVTVVHTGGMLCARHLFERLGGFDPYFDRGGADVDFSLRARNRCGVEPRIAEGAIYRTRPRSSGNATFRQRYRYGRSQVRLYERHRNEVAEESSHWSLLPRRLFDLARKSPWLLDPEKRTDYLSVAGWTCGRILWSVRLRVRYF